MAVGRMGHHSDDDDDEDQLQHDWNSHHLPEITREEIEESNVTREFSGSKYVSKVESRKVITEIESAGNNEMSRHFITPSQIPEPESLPESCQRQSASEFLFGRNTESSVFTNGLEPTTSGFTIDCEHRSLFGSDFGSNNNSRGNNLFDMHTNDNNHFFTGSFSTTKPKNLSSPGNTEAYAGYCHKPTKSNVDIHANFTSSNTEICGKGTYNIDKDNALVGLLAVNQEGSSWNSHGELAYQHKPTKSEVSVGVCNANGDTNLILKGQTKILRDRSHHAMDGSVLVKQKIGGTLGVNADLDYKHKPSDTRLTVGVMHHNNATTVNTGIDTKIKNKASLGVSGRYSCTPDSQSVVVQFSGNF